MINHVMIIAGEASGDLHASHLLAELKRRAPGVTACGIGGRLLIEQGLVSLVPMSQVSVLGLTEILKHWGSLKAAFRTISEALTKNKPDLLILVDFSGFNLRLAKVAAAQGIKVLYYISPHVWMWRKYRIKTIQRAVSHMAVIFPFEEDFYRAHGVPVTYVGNPSYYELLQQAPALTDVEPNAIGIFPGSRRGEIEKIFPTMLEAARELHRQHPDKPLLLPVANSLSKDFLASFIPNDLPVTLIEGPIHDTILQCAVIMSASGTVTFEIALREVLQVTCYKVSWLTGFIGEHFIDTSFYALCNLIAGTEIAKELFQRNFTVNNIVDEINKLLQDKHYADEKLKRMRDMRARFSVAENPAIGVVDIAMTL